MAVDIFEYAEINRIYVKSIKQVLTSWNYFREMELQNKPLKQTSALAMRSNIILRKIYFEVDREKVVVVP